MNDSQRGATRVLWIYRGFVLLLIAYGAVRFATAGVMPALQSLNGDFGASFPTAYFAKLRPEFPTGQVWEGWNYGPMFHFLTLPLLAVPRWSEVPKVWALTNGLALLVSFVLTVRLSRVGDRVSWLALGALAGLWLLFQPLANVFAQGNIEIVELLIVLAALTVMDRGRGYTAGALMGTAAMIKLLPIGFLGWFMLRQKWRAVAAGMIVVVGAVAIAAVTLDWKNNIFLQRSALVTQDPVTGLHELSITSLFAHRSGVLDADLPGVRWFPSPRIRQPLQAGRLASVLLAGVFGFLLVARRRTPVTPFDVSMVFLAMFMIIPWNHDYYYVFALVPISILFLTAIARDDRWLLAGVATAYLLISPPIPFGVIDRLHLASASFAYLVNFYDLPVFGGLVLWILATHMILTTDASPVSRLAWRRAFVGTVFVGLAITVWAVRARAHEPVAPKAVEVGPLAFDPPIATGESHPMALAPDGTRLAYVALMNGSTILCARAVGGGAAQCLEGTEEATSPFYSPDGQSIGFVRHDEVWIATPRDGHVRRLVAASEVHSPSWGDDGRILYRDSYGIRRIAPTGGQPEVVIPDVDEIYTHPTATPDPDVILFTYLQRDWSTGMIMAWSSKSHDMATVTSGSQPYLDPTSGQLVYAVGGQVVSAPYDVGRRQITGAGVPIVPSVLMSARGTAAFSVSASGAIAYVPATAAPAVRRTLAWVDRRGSMTPLAIPANDFEAPRLAPDDRQFAVVVRGGASDVWTYNAATLAATRVRSESALNTGPSWRSGDGSLWLLRALGAGTIIDRAVPTENAGDTLMWRETVPLSSAVWSPDGRWLATVDQSDIWILRPPGPTPKLTKASAFIRLFAPGADKQPAFSPDGKWLAYTSNQSGRDEIYVRPLLGLEDPVRVSTAGGQEPVWAPTGRELFYRVGDSVQAVDVTAADGLRASASRQLFTGPFASGQQQTNYDVAHDGQRFLMVMAPASFPQEVHVIRGWAATLPK